ncbi:hypothetical protein ACA910_016815 [Epithemia clementina (nom. ined.)]
MSHGYAFSHVQDSVHAMVSVSDVISFENFNLTEPQKELLRWHYRLGHMGFKKVQFLFCSGVLATAEGSRRLQTAACRLTSMPLCAACQFGKQTCRPTPGKISHAVQDRDGILKKDNLFPGQRVSVDHFVCATKGRLLASFGKTNPKDMYDGGCIFVDHASGYTHITMQAHLNTHETLQSKESFELLCRNVGVVPQEYLTDNGSAFKSRDYTASLVEFRQIY